MTRKGQEGSLREAENVLKIAWWGWVHNSVNLLKKKKITELFTNKKNIKLRSRPKALDLPLKPTLHKFHDHKGKDKFGFASTTGSSR